MTYIYISGELIEIPWEGKYFSEHLTADLEQKTVWNLALEASKLCETHVSYKYIWRCFYSQNQG